MKPSFHINLRGKSKSLQMLLSSLIVFAVAIGCFISVSIIGYKVVALLLLVTVSVLAMLLDILPVLLAAVLSALIWNFFFIPPIYTFHIDNTADLLMFLMYFVIALVNAVLTFKIREAENKVRDKEEKENAIKLYNTLLNSLSHELRTPIATIIGSVDTLKEHQTQLSKENQQTLLNEIDLAATRLNRQVENLLNMSRLETGMLRLNADWCDVNELIYNAIQKIELNTIRQTIAFIPSQTLPLFKLDAALMEEVVHTLLHNAVQYTPEQTVIAITASYEHEYCLIEIADNGNGFPESEIAFAFDKFYRLPHSKAGGTGLGLSIAKGFVEAHHGTIKLQNGIHGGAVFTIRIPAETSFINHLKYE